MKPLKRAKEARNHLTLCKAEVQNVGQESFLVSLHNCYGKLGGRRGPSSWIDTSNRVFLLKPRNSPILNDLQVKLRKPRRLSEIVVSKNPCHASPDLPSKNEKRHIKSSHTTTTKQERVWVLDGVPHVCGAPETGPLEVALARHDLRSLDGAHLGDPTLGGQHLSDSAELVRGVAGDADVVGALKDKLDVANLEDLGAALLGIVAGRVQKAVHKRVGKVEDGLRR